MVSPDTGYVKLKSNQLLKLHFVFNALPRPASQQLELIEEYLEPLPSYSGPLGAFLYYYVR
jgi:hypothetical protein